jgi:hypothetical protein
MDSKAVSRRGVPVNDSKSFTMKRAVAAAAVADATNGTPAVMNRAPSPTRGRPPKKRVEDHIEMRPLLFGASASEETGTSKPTSGTSSSPGNNSAQQFADTWLGGYVKLKAKQAEKHVYSLRASLKSKKGFHVQMPKRMLFYTVLVFFVLPLILFIIEEIFIIEVTHTHDHDPALHTYKLVDGNNDTNRTQFQWDDGPKSNLRQHPKGYTNNKQKKHPSLQQLLAGGLPPNSTVSNSRSRDHSGDVAVQAPESLHGLEVNQQDKKPVAYDTKASNASFVTAEVSDERLPFQAVPVTKGQGMEHATTNDDEETADKGSSPISQSNSILPIEYPGTLRDVGGVQGNTGLNGTRLSTIIAGNNTARRRRRRQR